MFRTSKGFAFFLSKYICFRYNLCYASYISVSSTITVINTQFYSKTFFFSVISILINSIAWKIQFFQSSIYSSLLSSNGDMGEGVCQVLLQVLSAVTLKAVNWIHILSSVREMSRGNWSAPRANVTRNLLYDKHLLCIKSNFDLRINKNKRTYPKIC